jgi:hypothetical protein
MHLSLLLLRVSFFHFSSRALDDAFSSAARTQQTIAPNNDSQQTMITNSHISACFNHSIIVKKELSRYKHWFQYKNYTKYPHDTLVLAQFRNPYEWLKAMEHVPHHAPAHLRTQIGADLLHHSANNDWQIFLTKPWTTERVGADLLMHGDELCQEEFRYKDIVSCSVEPLPHSHYNHTLRFSEHQPFYEMRNDGSGLPYDNIMEMRSDKIRNFLSVVDYPGVADVWNIQYEFLVQMGTQHLLDRIQQWTGIVPQCTAKDPQTRAPKASRVISPEFAAHVRQHLNWTVEAMIGYEPELARENAPVEWRQRTRRR